MSWEQWNARLVAPLPTTPIKHDPRASGPVSRTSTDSNSNHHHQNHHLDHLALTPASTPSASASASAAHNTVSSEQTGGGNTSLLYSSAESSCSAHSNASPSAAAMAAAVVAVAGAVGATLSPTSADASYASSTAGGGGSGGHLDASSLLDYDDVGYSPSKMLADGNGNNGCMSGPNGGSDQSGRNSSGGARILSTSGGGVHGDFPCPECGRMYKLKSSLRNHQKWECGKEPQFQCPYCTYKAKQKMHIGRHLERMHKDIVQPSLLKDLIAARVKMERVNKRGRSSGTAGGAGVGGGGVVGGGDSAALAGIGVAATSTPVAAVAVAVHGDVKGADK